ncbi:MAG: (2Fe-2S)-binding protein [Alphaproteobacteria bacterium]
MQVNLTVNGEAERVSAEPVQTLLDLLRERLGLTGTKLGCNQGVCGTCTVLIDGKLARSCLQLAVACEGREIVTIEGLSDNGKLSPLQQAFVESGAVQCGYCTPGMLMAAKVLLEEHAQPTIEQIRLGLSGNLCRCSGYTKIVDAVTLASTRGGA